MKQILTTISSCLQCPYRERMFPSGYYYEYHDKKYSSLNVCRLIVNPMEDGRKGLQIIEDIESIYEKCPLKDVPDVPEDPR